MPEVIEKKKRGRKPKSEKNSAQESASNKDSSKSDPQILHLNITRNSGSVNTDILSNSEIYENNYCNYTPDIIEPNAYNEHDQFISKPYEFVDGSLKQKSSNKVQINNTDRPYSDSIVCYWCCHKFDSTYLGLPMKYKNNVFHVSGCFCSFECMCAYNFYSNENNYNIWEIYNLINIMANIMEYGRQIYPAPPRKCLKMFGGYMSIDEFRNFKTSNKIININKTPYVVNIEQIEEINDFNHRNHDNVYTFDEERIESLEKKLSMLNEQNIKDNYKNTLDSCMNISNI